MGKKSLTPSETYPLDSPGNLIVQNILLGEHLLEAKRPSDKTVVASITIDFAENKEYFWTITK